MTLAIRPVLSDAWALFRRDRDWLWRVAGPFLFLPAFALALLVPGWPAAPAPGGTAGEAEALAWATTLTDWARAHGRWYVLAFAVTSFGAAVLQSAYLDAGAPDLRAALRRSGALLPRYLLAALLVAVPTGAGLFLWVLPGVYVMGRTMLTGPVLVAERPVSAGVAVVRSFALSRGAGLTMAALAGLALFAGVALAQPFARLDAAGEGVAADVVSAFGLAAASSLAGIAQVLIAVSAYRRLRAR